jgi:hypothetical protein
MCWKGRGGTETATRGLRYWVFHNARKWKWLGGASYQRMIYYPNQVSPRHIYYAKSGHGEDSTFWLHGHGMNDNPNFG